MRAGWDYNSDKCMGLKGKRVCMVSPFAPRKGGVAVQTELLAKHLSDEGVDVIKIDTNLQRLRIKWIGTPIRLALQPWIVLARLLLNIRKCDVVHIQGAVYWGFLPAIIAVPVSMLFRKPCILSFHSGAGPQFLDRFPSFIKSIFQHATKTSSVSLELQQELSKRGIDTEILNNLFDHETFTYRERKSIAPRFVWIRYLERFYDPMTALKTFEIVKQRYPDATLLLAGNGYLEGSLREYITEHEITGVTMPGMLSRAEVAKALRDADICLNTTRYDGLPTSLLEAAASGLPIVTTGAGGINSLFKNYEEAMVVPIGDSQALADAALELLDNPDYAFEMAKAARCVTELYTWETIRCRISELYNCECAKTNVVSGLSRIAKAALSIQIITGIIAIIASSDIS